MPHQWPVVDLFSGAGGMSCGFQRAPGFRLIGAADAQIGSRVRAPARSAATPATPPTSGSNRSPPTWPPPTRPTYAPRWAWRPAARCARGLPAVHRLLPRRWPAITYATTSRNDLVGRIGDYVALLRPTIVLIENARELVMGRFPVTCAASLAAGRARLPGPRPRTHFLTDSACRNDASGPSSSPRAGRCPARPGRPVAGWRVEPEGDPRPPRHLGPAAGPSRAADPATRCTWRPGSASAVNRRRLAAIPHDGGSWADLLGHPDARAC